MKITLEAARVNEGYSQKNAAALLGISNKTLYCWEKGLTMPSPNNIMKIEKLYNISYDNIKFFKEKTRLNRE